MVILFMKRLFAEEAFSDYFYKEYTLDYIYDREAGYISDFDHMCL